VPDAPALRGRRIRITLAVVVGLLIAINVADRFAPPHTGLVLGPLAAAVLVVLARQAGLSWDDLGMGRRSWRRGAAYAGVAVVLVAGGYALGAALPATRAAFLDVRYHLPPGPALVTALLVIPLGTVLLEEIAFRGVLLGLVRHHRGTAWAVGVSSALFGLWHVLPSLRLSRANHAVGTLVGSGSTGQLVAVAATVGFTALAGLVFCELRRRSGSVLAAAGLHWATNGLAVMVSAVLWTVRVA
jgi:membrane protease YdiL (CAAX protease family)